MRWKELWFPSVVSYCRNKFVIKRTTPIAVSQYINLSRRRLRLTEEDNVFHSPCERGHMRNIQRAKEHPSQNDNNNNKTSKTKAKKQNFQCVETLN